LTYPDRVPDSPTPASHTPAYDEVDLTTCDREPIHIPGAVQPHGVLLALDEDGRVVMASANTDVFLGVEVDRVIGRSLDEVVGAELAAAIAAGDETSRLGAAEVELRQHASGSRQVVEIEPVSDAGESRLTYQSTRGAMARLAQVSSVVDLAAQLAVEVRGLLGFDRVMVYRFDEEWNGEVIAEERRPDLNSFLGLHYPATDIPAQARRLYTVNWTRLIADIGYLPVPLHPVLDPSTGAPLDLSHATLRSVSPIHIEYLSHMGVTASMSISLIVDGELWGLVACHHYSGPHRPNHDARSAAEFLGQVASQLAGDRERSDARERTLAAQTVLGRIAARTTASVEPPLVSVMDDPELLPLVGATGAVLSYDGVVTRRGVVGLDDSQLQAVATALEDPYSYATSTDRIGELVPEVAGLADVAGVLRVGSAHDRWLLWFRPEQERIVDWGGDPTNKLLAATEGPEVRLSPRRSFEKWRQVVRGRSTPWAPWKLEVADALGKHMIGLLLARSRDQIAMAESVQRSVVPDDPPRFAGVELAARYQPASSFQLGGDWWDAFPLTDGRIVFVVGDVAGHGVSAASAMTQVRTALRAYLFEGHDAATSLDRLDLLMDGVLDQRVATAVLAVLDPATGRVELTSAGHLPPMLVTDDAAAEVPVVVRPLLGVGVGAAESVTIDLPPGATLLLYTDGLVERRDVDMAESVAGLGRLAHETHAGSDLEAWVDGLVAALEETSDDTTVLAIRVTRDG
jgi:two-component system, chemotaxis family, sensor kinase Cph1